VFAGRFTQITLRALDWLAARTLPPEDLPERHLTGRRGEEDAYFYLRRRGYTIISRNFRSPNHRGELDLVGWEGMSYVLSRLRHAPNATSSPLRPPWTAINKGICYRWLEIFYGTCHLRASGASM
jgi:hypothetical protein